MRKVFILHNTVQNYPWGSTEAIPALLGIGNPGGKPMAELWMGAHPKAPSRIVTDTGEQGLDTFLAAYPEHCLGDRVIDRFGRLPFLFKVLSAGAPLSIQAHPAREQAREGYAREQARGIPLDAPERNYRDDNHKPEIICALTPFTALRGFRSPAEIRDELGDPELPGTKDLFPPDDLPEREWLVGFFTALITADGERKERLLAALAARVRRRTDARAQWVRRLMQAYPGDIGVFAPLYLHLVNLAPGEAMFLPAGELHAYLEGTGMELMASSDNVLRGGLTAKHVDIPELLSVLTFETGYPAILKPSPAGSGGNGGMVFEEIYTVPAEEFRLSRIEVRGGRAAFPVSGPRILIMVEGTVTLRVPDGGSVHLERGESAFVAAAAGRLEFEGKGALYQASVGHEDLD